MKTLSKFALAYLLMWALSYIAVSIVSPEIGGSNLLGNFFLYEFLGWALITALLLYTTPARHFKDYVNVPYKVHERARRIIAARIILFVLAVVEVFGGVASWTGASMWNIPFPNKELFQVSMAFADLISAVFMFYLALFAED